MGITQARFQAVLTAADDAHTKLAGFKKLYQETLRDLTNAIESNDRERTFDLLNYMRFDLPNTFLPVQAYITLIATEQLYVKMSKSRNEAQRRYQARKRAAAKGIPVSPESDRRDNPERYTNPTSQSSKDCAKQLDEQKAQEHWEARERKRIQEESKPKPLETPPDDEKLVTMLSQHKRKINAFAKSQGLWEPYPNPDDDAQPLLDEHKRGLGLPVDSDDAPLF